MSMPRLKTCPICSHRKLQSVRRGRYTTRRGGRTVVVRDVDYQECPQCGEKFFDDGTMARIEHAGKPRRRATAG